MDRRPFMHYRIILGETACGIFARAVDELQMLEGQYTWQLDKVDCPECLAYFAKQED